MPENKKDLSEEDIKNRYITPALNAVGWAAEDMRMEKYFTDGRVIFQGGKHARKQGKKADYLLYSAPNYPIAIVEAKDNNHPMGGGLQQAITLTMVRFNKYLVPLPPLAEQKRIVAKLEQLFKVL